MPAVGSSAYLSASGVLNVVRALLDDASLGFSIAIAAAPNGAVENGAGTVATFTTAVPHGLATGQAATIAGVGSGFDGAYSSVTVTSLTAFTVPNTTAAPNATGGGGYMTPGGTAGDVFTDAVLIPLLNTAYHQLQFGLANVGVETFIKDDVVLTIPPTTAVDPSLQVIVNDTANQSSTTSPTPPLPTDLLVPLRLWERTTGSSEVFVPMVQKKDGLPSESQQVRLRYWEWRTDGLVFLGATQSNDVRMRYEVIYADIVQGSDPIQIRGAQDALAFYTAALAAKSRGSPLAADFQAAGEEAFRRMSVRAVRRQQHTMHRRKPYGGRRIPLSGPFV
jgi:hypothetical protein